MTARPWPGLGWALGILALALGAQTGAAWGWILLLGGRPDLTLLAGLANLTALTVVAALAFWLSGEGPAFHFPRLPVFFWIALGLSAAGGTVVLGEVGNVTAWLVPLPPELARMFNQLTEGPLAISLFALAFVAPLTEETLFRGLLLRSFERRYGWWPALVLSSALFAAFHLNVWQALAAFVAGLYLGWIYLKTQSLWPPMIAHGIFNGLPVVLAAVGGKVRGYNTATVAGAVEFQPWVWVLGGAVILAAGVVLTKKWAPLPPPPVSDTVGP